MTNVSIIIPVYNDPSGLNETLDSLLRHMPIDGEQHPEIIVVDNDSTDHTPEIALKYADRHNPVHLLHERDVQSSYAARNTGIERATGDVVVFFDADQTITDDWISIALDEIEDRDAHYLAPDVRLAEPDNPTLAGRYNYLTGFPNVEFIKRHGFAPTACLFVTHELLEDVGPFDDRLVSGGDKEFGNRVLKAGYDLHYAPNVVIHHPTRNSLRSLIKRNLRIGRGHCQLQQYYPERYGRVGVPPRPSGIHGDQIRISDLKQNDVNDDRRNAKPDGLEHMLLPLFAIVMTATRGVGYYRECLSLLLNRFTDG